MSAFRFVGHLFYWIKKQKIFPKKKRWERVNFDFRFGCNRDFHLLGEKVIIAFDIHIFDIWPLFVSHVIFKTWDDECLKVSYCVGDSWSHEKLPVCASEFISPKSLHPSVLHNAHFIVSSVQCYILTQHPHHLHPLLREHMRPDLDAWHPLWRGSQHAWWSCLQVLCLPFLTLISKAQDAWFQPIFAGSHY